MRCSTGWWLNKWVRPAETDVERVLAAAAAYWPTLLTTWVLGEIAGTPPTNSPVDMPAKTYDTDAFVSELVGDLIEWSGKTLFVHATAVGTYCLHYHSLTEGHVASISLTDGVADMATAFPISDPVLDRDGLDLTNRVIGRGTTISVDVSDATSIAAHDADGKKHEAIVPFDSDDTAELTVLATAFLTQRKDDRDTWHCMSGPFTSAQAAEIGPGYLVDVTSAVLGGAVTRKRIAHLTWRYDHPGNWWATFELGMPIRGPKPPKPAPALPPCGNADGTPISGTFQGHARHMFPGVKVNGAGGVTPSGTTVTVATPLPVGYDWNKTIEILGWTCPSGLQYHDLIEYHAVFRFDTTTAVRSDCTSGARLDFPTPLPDCACGPYEVVSGAYWATSTVTGAQFRQGKVIGVVDLSHGTDEAGPTSIDIPPEHINYGGYTVLAIRPKWRVDCPIVCSASIGGGDSYGSIHCSSADSDITFDHLVNTPSHWLQPCNVHSAGVGTSGTWTTGPLLTGLTLAAQACLTAWQSAVCAVIADDSAVPADNCADECCATWWRVCGHYKPGSLEVSVGGRVLRRNVDYWERANRSVFLLKHGNCETPQARYIGQ